MSVERPVCADPSTRRAALNVLASAARKSPTAMAALLDNVRGALGRGFARGCRWGSVGYLKAGFYVPREGCAPEDGPESRGCRLSCVCVARMEFPCFCPRRLDYELPSLHLPSTNTFTFLSVVISAWTSLMWMCFMAQQRGSPVGRSFRPLQMSGGGVVGWAAAPSVRNCQQWCSGREALLDPRYRNFWGGERDGFEAESRRYEEEFRLLW